MKALVSFIYLSYLGLQFVIVDSNIATPETFNNKNVIKRGEGTLYQPPTDTAIK